MFSLDIFSIFFLIGCVIAYCFDLHKRRGLKPIHRFVCPLAVGALLGFAILIRESYSTADLFRALCLLSLGMVLILSSDILALLKRSLPIVASCTANHSDNFFSNLLCLILFVFILAVLIGQSLGRQVSVPSFSQAILG